jgi:hypothetical protein
MAAPYAVTTRTRASSRRAGRRGADRRRVAAAPAFASRGLIQDLFFILTMLVLAQFWNLLAGYGGLVSVGQQAFVGIGAYALFGAVILGGADPVVSILIGGTGRARPCRAHGLLRLPPPRRLLRHRHLGHRRGRPPVGRAMAVGGRRDGYLAAARARSTA